MRNKSFIRFASTSPRMNVNDEVPFSNSNNENKCITFCLSAVREKWLSELIWLACNLMNNQKIALSAMTVQYLPLNCYNFFSSNFIDSDMTVDGHMFYWSANGCACNIQQLHLEWDRKKIQAIYRKINVWNVE